MAKRIYIATPSYDRPVADYYQSLLGTVPVLERSGYLVEWQNLTGCCYVHTARNKLVRDFLTSTADELIFIDADLGFEAADMLRLLAHDVDIVGGAAPFRVGDFGFPVNPLRDADGYPLGDVASGLIECDVLPTAIMRIRRDVFMRIAAAGMAPLRIEYNRKTSKENERYLSFFDFEADNEHNVEYGEDVSFCRKWRKIDGKLWCEPRMTIRHHSMDSFRSGNLDECLRPPIATSSAA